MAVARLDPAFFELRSHVAASQALDAFVRESNRGRHVWFVSDEAELRTRLGG